MPEPSEPAKITILAQHRAQRQSAKDTMYELLSRIDELEDALEVLDENGVENREQLEALIAELERRAAELDTED
jgi:chromosome segregation ATPase